MSRQSIDVPDAIKKIAEDAHTSVNTVAQWAFETYLNLVPRHGLRPNKQEETNNADSKRKTRR